MNPDMPNVSIKSFALAALFCIFALSVTPVAYSQGVSSTEINASSNYYAVEGQQFLTQVQNAYLQTTLPKTASLCRSMQATLTRSLERNSPATPSCLLRRTWFGPSTGERKCSPPSSRRCFPMQSINWPGMIIRARMESVSAQPRTLPASSTTMRSSRHPNGCLPACIAYHAGLHRQ